METAKLGPLAFYKVPTWGRMGWAGGVEWGRLGWLVAEVSAQSSAGTLLPKPDWFLCQSFCYSSADAAVMLH